jgi:hypothetical protein
VVVDIIVVGGGSLNREGVLYKISTSHDSPGLYFFVSFCSTHIRGLSLTFIMTLLFLSLLSYM